MSNFGVRERRPERWLKSRPPPPPLPPRPRGFKMTPTKQQVHMPLLQSTSGCSFVLELQNAVASRQQQDQNQVAKVVADTEPQDDSEWFEQEQTRQQEEAVDIEEDEEPKRAETSCQEEFDCPICFEPFWMQSELSILQCETCCNNFCAECFTQCLAKTKGTCPMCRCDSHTPRENVELVERMKHLKTNCDGCGLEMHMRDLIQHENACLARQQSQSLEEGEAEEEEDFWACKRCTFHNCIGAKVCEMCYASFVENGILRRQSTEEKGQEESRIQSDQAAAHPPRVPVPAPSPSLSPSSSLSASSPSSCSPSAPPLPPTSPPTLRLQAPTSQTTRTEREQSVVPVARSVRPESMQVQNNIIVPVAEPVGVSAEPSSREGGGVVEGFTGELLLKTSSKVVFTKWKKVIVTIKGKKLMIHDIMWKGRSLSERNAIKTITLHRFMFLEKERIVRNVTVSEKVVTKRDIRKRAQQVERITRMRLFENPPELACRHVNEFSASLVHSIVVELAALNRSDLIAFAQAYTALR